MDHHGVHQALDLLGFLTLGLLGGLGHCVGMCSPFVLLVSRRYPLSASVPGGVGGAAIAWRRHRAVMAAQAWYTAGRILTYSVLGATAGAVGSAVELGGRLMGLRRAALLLAGGLLIAWALLALSDLWSLQGRRAPFGRLAGAIARAGLPAGVRRRVPDHPFTMGMFLGLLPCGFLYSAVVAAVALGGPLAGAAALALFGLGTAPALLGFSLADEFLLRTRGRINRLAQVFILVMGAWFVWRALSG